eukprot:1964638-Prymnesium_polylepis.1
MKEFARAIVNQTQNHWTPRQAVHVWDRLELSRTQMETLTHLLSDVLDPGSLAYVSLNAWVNPHDDTDFLNVARLASRYRREKEYNRIAEQMNISVNAKGR